MHIKGKVALVTGGARGIGKAISEVLLEKGGKVCIADWDATTGAQTATEFEARYGENTAFCQKLDVSSMTHFEEAIQATERKYGRIDIIVNNAGVLDENNLSKMIGVNVGGVFNGTALAVKYLKKTGGVVVNISSVQGLTVVPFDAFYTGTKHAVVGVTRAMAQREAESGVRFNCLCPCFVLTDMLKEAMVDFDEDTKAYLDRFGVISPSVIGEAVTKLVEDDSLNGCVMVASKYKGISPAYVPTMSDVAGEKPRS